MKKLDDDSTKEIKSHKTLNNHERYASKILQKVSFKKIEDSNQ